MGLMSSHQIRTECLPHHDEWHASACHTEFKLDADFVCWHVVEHEVCVALDIHRHSYDAEANSALPAAEIRKCHRRTALTVYVSASDLFGEIIVLQLHVIKIRHTLFGDRESVKGERERGGGGSERIQKILHYSVTQTFPQFCGKFYFSQ